jgi:hypothetical protein
MSTTRSSGDVWRRKGFDPHGGEGVWHDETAGMANLQRRWAYGL